MIRSRGIIMGFRSLWRGRRRAGRLRCWRCRSSGGLSEEDERLSNHYTIKDLVLETEGGFDGVQKQ